MGCHSADVAERRAALLRFQTGQQRACTSIAPAIWSNGSSTKLNNVGMSDLTTTNLQPTTSPSSSLRQSGYGCALMSPRLDCLSCSARTGLTIGGIAFSTPFADNPHAGKTSEQSVTNDPVAATGARFPMMPGAASASLWIRTVLAT